MFITFQITNKRTFSTDRSTSKPFLRIFNLKIQNDQKYNRKQWRYLKGQKFGDFSVTIFDNIGMRVNFAYLIIFEIEIPVHVLSPQIEITPHPIINHKDKTEKRAH